MYGERETLIFHPHSRKPAKLQHSNAAFQRPDAAARFSSAASRFRAMIADHARHLYARPIY